MSDVTPRGRFPHARRVGDFVYVSGTSARRPDNTIEGAEVDELGTTALDIRVQTRAVLENVKGILAEHGAGVRSAHIRDFPLPPLNVDLLERVGLPDSARAFGDLLTATDGFVIVAPEYNYSVSGVLKNLIDWVSRIKPWPFIGRHGLLMSADGTTLRAMRFMTIEPSALPAVPENYEGQIVDYVGTGPKVVRLVR